MGTRQDSAWSLPGWREQTDAWLDRQLASIGLERLGPSEQVRVRPWSTLLLVPTTGGKLRLKSTAPDMANDAGVTTVLAQIAPDAVLTPLAVDVEMRLVLLPDGGSLLADELAAHPRLEHWESILARLGQLQWEATGSARDLLQVGALDRRLAGLPLSFVYLLDRLDEVPEPLDDPLLPSELSQLRLATGPFMAACRELDAYGIPDSVQHDDFHDGNILLSGEPGDGFGYRFVDWGDAYVGQPFGVLLVALRSVADRFALSDESPEIARLIDIYLEPWTALLPRSRLRRAVSLARRIAAIPRVLTWHAALRGASDAERARWAFGPVAWLREIATQWSGGATRET